MTEKKYRANLTDSEKSLIRALTLRGVRQSVIARELKIGRDTVALWQVRMGLPTHLVIPEQKILELFQQGWGGHRISKHLHVPANQVYAVAHKNKFRRADGIGYPEVHGDVEAFIEEIKNRTDYIKHLAAKYGLNPGQAQRIARRVLGTVQFRSGRSKPALSSAFPQKYHDRHV